MREVQRECVVEAHEAQVEELDNMMRKILFVGDGDDWQARHNDDQLRVRDVDCGVEVQSAQDWRHRAAEQGHQALAGDADRHPSTSATSRSREGGRDHGRR